MVYLCYHCLLLQPLWSCGVITDASFALSFVWWLSTGAFAVYKRCNCVLALSLSVCVIDLTTVPSVLSILMFSIAYLFFNCLQVLQLSNYATIVYWFPVVNWCYHCHPVSFPNISFFLTLTKKNCCRFHMVHFHDHCINCWI